MKILIVNLYNYLNKGDSAIVLGMLRDLSERFSVEEFVLSSSHFAEDTTFYTAYQGVPIRTTSSLFRIVHHASVPLKALRWLLSILWITARIYTWPLLRRLQFSQEIQALITEYARADVIISCGGGYLYTNHRTRGVINMYIYAYSFFIGTLLHKPVILYAQSIGPFFSRWHGKLLAFFLNRAQAILLREDISYNIVQSLHLRTTVVRTGDAAFFMLPQPPAESLVERIMTLRNAKRMVIGMTVRAWLPETEQRAYEHKMLTCAEYLIRTYHADIICIPQVMIPNGDNDVEIADRIHQSAAQDTQRHIHVWTDDIPPAELKALVGMCDMFIGTRMHSNIFALNMCVPTVAIGYLPKTRGIMRSLDLERYVIDIERISPEEMQRLCDTIIQEAPNIQRQLKDAMHRSAIEAQKNSAVIAQVLESYADTVHST